MAGKGAKVDLTGAVQWEQEEKARRDAAFPPQTGREREKTSSSAFTSWFTCSVAVLSSRDAVSNQDMESQLDFQKSTGAFISDKDRELEILRNEVPLR